MNCKFKFRCWTVWSDYLHLNYNCMNIEFWPM